MIEGKYGFREVMIKGNGIGNTLTSKSNGKSKGLAWGSGMGNGQVRSDREMGRTGQREMGGEMGNG